MPRVSDDYRRARRDEIARAAIRCLERKGVHDTSIAANPWGNVVLLHAHAADTAIAGLELLLKGGQVGSDELFESVRALLG